MNLTIKEAYLKMKDGERISHKLFCYDEYLYIDKDGIIRDENGYNFSEGWFSMMEDNDYSEDWFIK